MTKFYIDPNAPVQPDQFEEEFWKVLALYESHNPRVVVEIGSREGGTLYQWMKNTKPGALIVSIELPNLAWGTTKPVDTGEWFVWAETFGHEFHLIAANSHSLTTKRVLRTILGGRGIDWLFIDADHTLAGVMADHLLYRELVSIGGLVAFHDILLDTSDRRIEVYKYWKELKEWGGKFLEYTSEKDQKSRGIGVIRHG